MGSEILLIFLALAVLAVVVVGGILGVIAFFYVLGARRRLEGLRRDLDAVRRGLGEMEAGRGVAPEAPRAAAQKPPAPPPAVTEAPVCAAEPTEPAPILEPVAAGGMTVPSEAPVAAPVGGLESAIGKQWIAWAGAVVLFLGVAFFLKYAFDNYWIGPTGQVIIGALAGAAILLTGSRFVGKGWRVFGQCIMGLALAILYATFFAAFGVYEEPVLSQNVAFGCMVAVTAAGVALAILHDAMPMAFLAVLGGLLTPILLSTGKDARDALFTYLLLLDLGVLAVAFFRGWRLLDAVALAGTFVLYGGWYAQFYKPAGLAPALGWLGAFYAVFLALPFVYHLVRRISFTIERFVMALANAAFVFGFAWHMLHGQYSFALGFVALGMAAAYLTLGAVVRRRLPDDAPTLFGAIAMTVTFLTLAIPLQLRANGIMLAWALEGPVLVYLGYRFRYLPVRAFAAGVLAVAVGRLFLAGDHWPLHEGLYVLVFNRRFLTAMMVPLAMGLYAAIHHWQRKESTAADRAMKLACALVAGVVALVVASAEAGGWVDDKFGKIAATASVTVLWALGAWAYLGAGRRARAAAGYTWGVGALVLGVSAIFGFGSFAQYIGREHLLVLNVRFGAGLLVVAAALGYGWTVLRARFDEANQHLSLAFGRIGLAAGMAGLLSLLSVEAYTYCHDVISDTTQATRAGQMSVTLIWGAYAAGLLAVGFWRRVRALRLAGLGLFALSAVKLVLVDMTGMQDIFRIVSFVALGLLMVAASYLYHRLEQRLLGPQPAPAEAAGPNANGESL